MLIGAGLSLRQHDLKLVLAYSTVGALGTMVLLVGIGNDYAVVAAMALLLAHALYKAGLFLVTGIVDHEMGTRELDRIGGLVRIMPLTAVAAALGAVSMAGIPPMIGFAGKELGLKAGLDMAECALFVTAALVIAGAATVGAAAIVSAGPFAGRLEMARERGHEPGWPMWLGPLASASSACWPAFCPSSDRARWWRRRPRSSASTQPKYGVEPWYGVDLALLLSVTSIAIGVAHLLATTRPAGDHRTRRPWPSYRSREGVRRPRAVRC